MDIIQHLLINQWMNLGLTENRFKLVPKVFIYFITVHLSPTRLLEFSHCFIYILNVEFGIYTHVDLSWHITTVERDGITKINNRVVEVVRRFENKKRIFAIKKY